MKIWPNRILAEIWHGTGMYRISLVLCRYSKMNNTLNFLGIYPGSMSLSRSLLLSVNGPQEYLFVDPVVVLR